MREPRFWSNSPHAPGWQARLLAPLGALYAAATRRRVRREGYKALVPVICVGNINAGGTGKTPTVIALIQALGSRGRVVHVVSRGYGGTEEGPLQVNERVRTAQQVGDEPLLMAAFGPVWVARDRAEGVRAAEAGGAEIILLDDGFQNPSVAKTASLVVVDAKVGFGNGRCIPAGPLRERVHEGLARAQGIVLIGSEAAQHEFMVAHATELHDVPVFSATVRPLNTGMLWNGLRAFAFAGIGRPAKFFETLKDQGVELVAARSLDDHQPLTSTLFNRLEREAKALGAQLVTTEKDAVRLSPDLRRKVLTLPVRLEFDDEPGLLARLDLD